MIPLKNKHNTKTPLLSIKTVDYKHVSSFVCDKPSPNVCCFLFVEDAGCDGSDESENAEIKIGGGHKMSPTMFLPFHPALLIPLKCLEFWYYMGHNCLYTPYFFPNYPSGCLQSYLSLIFGCNCGPNASAKRLLINIWHMKSSG